MSDEPNQIPQPYSANKHERHQEMLEQHRQQKAQRADDHKRRKEFRSCPPNCLV